MPSIPHDAATICLKCLAKESADRFATAAELADHLDVILRLRAAAEGAAAVIFQQPNFFGCLEPAPALAAAANEAGALSRVVGLFSARAYNIETLTVAPTEDPTLSRMTIVTTGNDDTIEQITKHLNRLIEVVKVVDLTEGAYTERELMLVKVRAVGKEREEMKRMADIFRGRIIDVTEKSYTIELTGDLAKNDAFLEAIDRSAILETVRTGACGIGRGERILRV